jgi:hypothetical protein
MCDTPEDGHLRHPPLSQVESVLKDIRHKPPTSLEKDKRKEEVQAASRPIKPHDIAEWPDGYTKGLPTVAGIKRRD